MGSIHSRHAMLLLPIIVGVCSVAPFDHPSFNHDSRDSMLGMQMYIHTLCFSTTPDDDHVNPAVHIQLQFLLETMSPEIIPAAVVAGDASILREYLTKCPHEVTAIVYIVLASFPDLVMLSTLFHSYKRMSGGLGRGYIVPYCHHMSMLPGVVPVKHMSLNATMFGTSVVVYGV